MSQHFASHSTSPQRRRERFTLAHSSWLTLLATLIAAILQLWLRAPASFLLLSGVFGIAVGYCFIRHWRYNTLVSFTVFGVVATQSYIFAKYFSGLERAVGDSLVERIPYIFLHAACTFAVVFAMLRLARRRILHMLMTTMATDQSANADVEQRK